jgi:hypothetical protein
VCVILGVALVALLGSGGDDPRANVRLAAGSVTPSTMPATTTPPTAAPTTTTTTDSGALPQTMDKPTAQSSSFQARVQGLWQAIVADTPGPGMPFFFPLSAYLQVKAISNPTGDWNTRLVANYGADIHALHAQLGAAASRAKLVDLQVPDAAQWILPGAEANKGSYWRVYGTVLRYSVDGVVSTFPVTSMISWRGEWYVVHLGAIR